MRLLRVFHLAAGLPHLLRRRRHLNLWPAPGIASDKAFITAAIAAVVPASPAPLTPSGLVVAGTSTTSSLNIGK